MPTEGLDEETLKLARRMVNARLRDAGRQAASFELGPLEIVVYASEADRSEQWFDSDGNKYDRKPVVVDRKLLEEALEHVTECFERSTDYGSNSECYSCRTEIDMENGKFVWKHGDDCQHVRVVDGLTKALGQT